MVPFMSSEAFEKAVFSGPGLTHVYQLIISIESVDSTLQSEIDWMSFLAASGCTEERTQVALTWPTPTNSVNRPM